MPDYKNVLSIDPGGTTGLAIRNRNNITEDRNWMTAVCTEWEELCDLITEGLEYVVIENFKAEHISTYGLHTVRLVGGTMFVCRKLDIPLVIHQPQDRRSFITDAREMLVARGGKFMTHEVDALAHLLKWEFDNDV